MISKEVYCFTWNICDRLLHENAPITSRGIFGAWSRLGDFAHVITITLRSIECNTIMGCHV